jgi:hypothetical protein
MADCEERITLTDVSGTERDVWADADYPWQDGRTAEDCLKAALIWVTTS